MMSKNDQARRLEFRRAIADEVATLRAVNTALRGPLSPAESVRLIEVRQSSMAILMAHFTTLYPRRKLMQSVRAVQRLGESK